MLGFDDRLVGDAWFFPHGGVVHAYFLTCDAGRQRHEHWDVGHAVSEDLARWRDLGVCLPKAGPDAWDRNLATGSVLARGGRFWMAYTGHSAARVGVAVSDDLHRWRRLPGPATAPDSRYYEPVGTGNRRMTHWRDPFLFEHDGHVYHAVTASRPDAPAGRRGAVGLARSRDSRDLRAWDVLPPMDVEAVCQELECPQVIERGGRWYLIFSTAPPLLSEDVRRDRPDLAGRPGTHAMVGPSPLGPFALRRDGPFTPPGVYAAQVVRHGGRDWALGTDLAAADGRGAISDPVPVAFDADGVTAAS